MRVLWKSLLTLIAARAVKTTVSKYMVRSIHTFLLFVLISSNFNSIYIIIGMDINQPKLPNISSTARLDAIVAEKLELTSWLMQVPLMSWVDMEMISQYDQASSFDLWFNDLLHILNTIATSLHVPKDVRTYASHLCDYVSLKNTEMEQYWLKARNSQRVSTEPDGDTSQPSTPPGTDSLVINSKRKYHENYDTPDSIKRHILDIKATLKFKEIETGMILHKEMLVDRVSISFHFRYSEIERLWIHSAYSVRLEQALNTRYSVLQ